MITVDEIEMEWEEGMTVSSLLEIVKPDFPMFVVKINGVMISKRDHETTPVPDGAEVRIVYMIAGG